MEVKSSETQSEIDDKKGELEAEMGLQIGPFSMKAKVKGSIRRSTPQVSRKLRQQEHRGKNIIQLIMMLPDEV